jgi:hypothetical protein
LLGVSTVALVFAQIGPGEGALRGAYAGLSGRMGPATQRDAATPADLQLVREMVTKHDRSYIR